MDKDLHLKLTVRLYTDDNQRCFGPGIATLLHRVEEHRSLRRRQPPWEWLTPRPGASSAPPKGSLGASCSPPPSAAQHGGGAVLTDQAVRLLGAYDAYCARRTGLQSEPL